MIWKNPHFYSCPGGGSNAPLVFEKKGRQQQTYRITTKKHFWLRIIMVFKITWSEKTYFSLGGILLSLVRLLPTHPRWDECWQSCSSWSFWHLELQPVTVSLCCCSLSLSCVCFVWSACPHSSWYHLFSIILSSHAPSRVRDNFCIVHTKFFSHIEKTD